MPEKSVESIKLEKVGTNNLKDIDVNFPLGEITVVTGVSGSGKSSLVFDTLYGESYRRYVESLSSFARQYMQSIPKPTIEHVVNLPPAIAVKQVKSQANSRSTVGTATELYDLIRMVYTHLGRVHCTVCGKEVTAHNVESIVRDLKENYDGKRVMICAGMERYQNTKLKDLKNQFMTFGFVRAVVDGKVERIEKLTLGKLLKSNIVIDRVTVNEDNMSRCLESVKTAMQLSKGSVVVIDDDFKIESYPTTLTHCGKEYRKPTPALFSFNHPIGACGTCQGFGAEGVVDWEKVFPDLDMSVKDRGVVPWNFGSHDDMYEWARGSARTNKVPVGKTFREYTKKDWEWIKFGTAKDDFEGVQGYFDWLNSKRHKAHYRIHAARFRKYVTCRACHGYRLNPDALAVKVLGKHIGEIGDLTLVELKSFLSSIVETHPEDDKAFGVKEALEESIQRIDYLLRVGLGYLSINRQSRTLSGGEYQRINMARCLGSALTDTLYCLDEPTSGLHARDGERLMSVIQDLRDQGNTVVVVEHERTVIDKSDHLIEIGPEAGHRGGEVTFQGVPKDRKKTKGLNPNKSSFSKGEGQLVLKGAETHNLQNIDVKFQLGAMNVVCGVSGSGKTSLIQHTLYPTLAKALNQKKIDGYVGETQVKSVGPASSLKKLAQVIHVSQTTIGRSSRSTIATYLGLMVDIRKILAATPAAKVSKLEARHFSFNTSGGRCETCKGLGTVIEDLSFLGEMAVECPDCHGKRFKDVVLDVRYREKNLNDILALTVQQARELFFDEKSLVKTLDMIIDLGLGYITLGQGTSSFSGGEAQRLKLLRLLQDALKSKPSFLIFDEPTTGLSDYDVSNLIEQFRGLLAKGHTVLVVEHHLDVIKAADWLIEIGPEAASDGGQVVYEGPVVGLKKVKGSITSRFLN